MLAVLTLLALVSHSFALPATGQQLDKATINDVAVNTVAPAEVTEHTTKSENKIEISGISTGTQNPSFEESHPFKPQRAGTMFARFIDDIFQIPISVLQSVARLITNPFTQQKKSPESAIQS